jgi:hypothetical protein
MTAIHDDLERLSGLKPAGYITQWPLSHVMISNLLYTISLLKGREIPAGNLQLSASLRDVSWSNGGNIQGKLVAPTNPIFPDSEVDILINSDFTVFVDIFVAKNPASKISEVAIEISNAVAHLRAEDNVLVIDGSDFSTRRNILRTVDADALLAADGIDPLEAARIEGHIGYGVVSQAVSAALGQRRELALSKVFPAVNFGTAIKLAIIDGGDALGIIPTDLVTINFSAHCECNEGPDYEVGETEIVNTSPANPGPNDEVGSVTIGGPISDNKDPLVDFGKRSPNRDGAAGLYVPRDFASALTVDVMPAIKIKASDNGTIGYRAEASIGFQNFKVSFDLVGGGILLDIDMDISVNAYCDFELFKGVRVPIGWAIVLPANGSNPAHLQIGFYPSIDNSGALKLKSTLKQADMGKYVAVIIGIGTALEIIGVTAWIGFLIDVVLSTILSTGLPITLKKEIGKYVGSKEWKLLDGLPVLPTNEKPFWTAPFDVRPNSLLASVEFKG